MSRPRDIIATITEKWRALAIEDDSQVLLGVSGGLDSVVLLDALATRARALQVAHLDHRLRGKESAADARFTRALAAKYGCGIQVGRVDVAALAEREKLSLEAAGRQARRAFFARVAGRTGAAALVLAHHADDQAETVLWNLARGAGLRGVAGMAGDEWQDFPGGVRLRVLRPMLGLRRADLLAHARARGLEWREDASNSDPAFTRNRIRHAVLPALETAAGRDAAVAIGRFAAIAHDENCLLENIAAEARARLSNPDGSLDVPGFRALPPALQRRVAQAWLGAAGVPLAGLREVEAVMALANRATPPARANLPGGSHVRRREKKLFLQIA